MNGAETPLSPPPKLLLLLLLSLLSRVTALILSAPRMTTDDVFVL